MYEGGDYALISQGSGMMSTLRAYVKKIWYVFKLSLSPGVF